MDLDKYEQELLNNTENTESLEQLDNYDDVLF